MDQEDCELRVLMGQATMAFSSQSRVCYPLHESSEDQQRKIKEAPDATRMSEEGVEDFDPRVEKFPRTYKIYDSQQMVWVLEGNSLIAVPASSNVKPVTLRLIACRDTEFQDIEKGNLVFLGIKGKSLCLFCTEIGSTPTLQLKNVDIMTIYNESKAEKDFLFYHSTEGSTCAFESVSYPGWFIGTPATARQTVTLTQQRGETTSTNFYLEAED